MTFGCSVGAGHDGLHVKQISYTRLTLSDRGMSLSSGTRSSES